MISPYVEDKLLNDIHNTYEEAENIMLKKVAKRVEKGIDKPGWAEKKQREVRALKKDLSKTIKGKSTLSAEKIDEVTNKAYKAGFNSANKDLGLDYVLATDIKVPSKVSRLAGEIKSKTSQADMKILRSTIDSYREVIAKGSKQVLTGTEVRLKATQQALNEFADKGITSFVDKAGRRWDMATYAEMSTRTTVGRAAIQGHIDRQTARGRDLVKISNHSRSCPLCSPWEGKVLSLTGKTPGYVTLDTAMAQGLFHPNCKHTLVGYVPGLTRTPTIEQDPEGYKLTQQQRYNERQIRKYKRRSSVALSDKERQVSEAKVRSWQNRQRELLKDTDLTRKSNRESISGVR